MKTVRFQSSRLTKGNFFFPDRIRLEAESIVFCKRRFIGGEEESIPYEQIASVSVQRGVFFSELLFETTGGSEPIFLNGLWAGDAEKAQAALRLRMRDRSLKNEDRMINLMEEQTRLLREIAGLLRKSA